MSDVTPQVVSPTAFAEVGDSPRKQHRSRKEKQDQSRPIKKDEVVAGFALGGRDLSAS